MARLPDTRASLIVRLAKPADHAAWTEFTSNYELAVFRYCRSHGLQEADARDVVQEVLLLVHRRIAEWKPSGRRGSFRVWLLRTAHRLCLKSMRERARADRGAGGTSVQKRLQELAPADADPGVAELEWRRWAFGWAAAEVQRETRPASWQAFWLSAVEGVAAEEVARRLGIRVGSVYANKCRVLARIRERVRELSRSES